MSETLRMGRALPELHIPWPECGHCNRQVDIEDGVAYCNGCLIEWSKIEEGVAATPMDDGEGSPRERCGTASTSAPYQEHEARGSHFTPGPLLPCILPDVHKGRHHHPYDVEVRPVSGNEEGAATDAK